MTGVLPAPPSGPSARGHAHPPQGARQACAPHRPDSEKGPVCVFPCAVPTWGISPSDRLHVDVGARKSFKNRRSLYIPRYLPFLVIPSRRDEN